MAEFPASILRPSIIVGDAQSGRTNAFKALYAPLRLLVRNLVRFLPCEENTTLDVVPVDYVSRAICHLLFDDGASIGRTLHLTAGGAASSTVGEIVRGAMVAGAHSGPARVEFVSPREFNFAEVTSAGERALIAALAQFAPYLAINRDFDDTQTRMLLEGSGISARPFNSYLSTILRFAVETAWGRRFALAA
jgi:nucleoside-diphosphate-sugar epimerase